jgi:hypothetical protein
MKSRSFEIGFESGGSTLPLASLKDPERSDLLNIASAGVDPRYARRALYSELVGAGLGFESIAFMSEHGPNAFLPGGPYSLAPFRVYFDWGKEVLNSLFQQSGLTSLYSALGEQISRAEFVPQVSCKFGAPDTSMDEEGSRLDLPGIHPLPIPTPEEWRAFQAALAGLDRFLNRVDSRSTENSSTALLYFFARVACH